MNVPALLATYQLRQREYLLRITRAMTSRLDLPSLLKLILSSAAEMVGCRAGLIVLARHQARPGVSVESTPRFQIRAVYNIPSQYWSAFEPLLDIQLTVPEAEGEIVEAGDPAEEGTGEETVDGEGNGVDDLSPSMLDLQARVRRVEEQLGITLGQVVGLPLLFEDELLGIIYLFRSEYAFTQMDWQFVRGFADQAAIAVRNARLYQQLAAERSRLATIIGSSADGILILDGDRRVVVINQALAAMVGMTEQDALGRPCQEVLSLDNLVGEDLCQSETLEALDDRVSRRCEGDLIRPGGGRITVSAIFTPLFDADHLVNVIVNVHDITHFREEEEMKSTFTSIISHELKTPVALIKGYAQTLARPDAAWDSATAQQGLQIIEEEADRLEALINNLLDASRIQAGGLRLDSADVDIEALTRKVAAAYRTQTDVHQIELDFPHPLPLIWGDEERLRQVLTNLLSNAIKYAPDGGVIRVGGWTAQPAAHDGPARVVLFVADQGIGIPQEELGHIFDRFYRVDSSLRRGTAGAGLGLFLTKSIVEAHGGQIWARSEPGKGTTFFVALPVEPSPGGPLPATAVPVA